MDTDDRIKLTDGEDFSSLVIKSVSQGDGGNYTCTAKNLYGVDSMTTQVIVQGNFALLMANCYNLIQLQLHLSGFNNRGTQLCSLDQMLVSFARPRVVQCPK